MTIQCVTCGFAFVPTVIMERCERCRADGLQAALMDAKAALLAVKVAHRHDCPKTRPRRDAVCSLGVLHLGSENSRCDCYADATDMQIKSVADKIDAVLKA